MLTKHTKPDFQLLVSHPAHFLSFGFGAGLAPRAPGTFGTIVGVPLFVLMSMYLGHTFYFWVAIAVVVLGVWVCGVTDKALGTEDHGAIVWDEIAGYLITMFMAPLTW